MSVEVKLELGHRAVMRDKVTAEGFTHDWNVFVRGAEGNDIKHFVEKVVFHLHESFPKPKRVVKEPPYSVAESGYAGFIMPIEVYFRTREEPKKVTFKYDLYLRLESPPVSNIRIEKLTFQNPSDDFRGKLIKAGGIAGPLSGSATGGSASLSTQACAPPQHVDDHHTSHSKPALPEKKPRSHIPSKELPLKSSQQSQINKPKPSQPSQPFTDLFGTPIRTKSSPDPASVKTKDPGHSSQTKNKIPPNNTSSTSSKEPKSSTKESHKAKVSHSKEARSTSKEVKEVQLSGKDTHPPKDLHSTPKDSHPQPKDSYPQPKDSYSQQKVSHSQPKSVPSQQKDSHSQLKVPHSQAKDSQAQSKDLHQQATTAKGSPHPQQKDLHAQTKDSHSSKDIHKTTKDSNNVKECYSKEGHIKEGHKIKESHHLPKEKSAQKGTQPETKDPKPPKSVKLEKDSNKTPSVKRPAPVEPHSSHGNVEKKKKSSPALSESNDKSSNHSKPKSKENKEKTEKHKIKSHSSTFKKPEEKLKLKNNPAPLPETKDIVKSKLSSPVKAASPIVKPPSPPPLLLPPPPPPPPLLMPPPAPVAKPPSPITKPPSPIAKPPSPDSSSISSDSDESEKNFRNKAEYSSPASSISESSLHGNNPLSGIISDHSILSPLSDDDDDVLPPPPKRKINNECDFDSDSPNSKNEKTKSMPKLKKTHDQSHKSKPSENHHTGNGSINSDISLHQSMGNVLEDQTNNTAYRKELYELQKIIMECTDKKMLQSIVDLIEKTGKYEITSTTFDFDLCSLEPAIIQKIKHCITNSNTKCYRL